MFTKFKRLGERIDTGDSQNTMTDHPLLTKSIWDRLEFVVTKINKDKMLLAKSEKKFSTAIDERIDYNYS